MMSKIDIALKIFRGQKLTKKEFEKAVKENLIMGGVNIDEEYRKFLLECYEDDERYCYINTNRTRWLNRELSFVGLYPTHLKREYISAEQLEYLHALGWKDEEIGCERTDNADTRSREASA